MKTLPILLSLIAVFCLASCGSQQPASSTPGVPTSPTPTSPATPAVTVADKGTAEPKKSENADANANPNVVTIDNFTFSPRELTVPVNTTVTWLNRDDIPHTVRETKKRFTSPTLDTDEKFSYTFTEAGTYDYFCTIHTHMTGKIIVK